MMRNVSYTSTLKWRKVIWKEVQKIEGKRDGEKEINMGRIETGTEKEIRNEDEIGSKEREITK
jgi:hypothetical protein